MSAPPAAAAEGRDGWLVVGAAFATTFVGFGSAYSFSAFMPLLEAEFDASRAALALVFSLAGFLYFSLGAISGPLADRWGARPLVVAGMTLLAAGLALAGSARDLAEVYIAYGVGVGGGIGLAYVPMLAAVQRWFVARRALASGLAVSGIGIGTLVVAPLAGWSIGLFGWRTTFLLLGAMVGTVGVGAALLAKEPPAAGATAARRHGTGLFGVVTTPAFRRLYLTCLACGLGAFVPFVHLVPYARDHGVEATSASALIAFVGAGSTAGRFVLGGVADRMGRDRFMVGTYIAIALAMLMWALSSDGLALAVFAVAFGIFYGGWVAVLPSVVADRFGTERLSGVMGLLYTSVAVGTLVGPVAAGLLYDATGDYSLLFVFSITGVLIAAMVAGWDGAASGWRRSVNAGGSSKARRP